MIKRARWTILNVDEMVIKIVKVYAARNGLRAEKALQDLIMRSKAAQSIHEELTSEEGNDDVRQS